MQNVYSETKHAEPCRLKRGKVYMGLKAILTFLTPSELETNQLMKLYLSTQYTNPNFTKKFHLFPFFHIRSENH